MRSVICINRRASTSYPGIALVFFSFFFVLLALFLRVIHPFF